MDENEKTQEQIDIENITCNKTEYNYFETLSITRRTLNVCLAAIKDNINNLKYVPKKCITDEIILSVLCSDMYYAIDLIPKQYLTDEIYLRGVILKPSLLKYLPEHLKTEKVCIEALKKNPVLLPFVGRSNLTRDMCRIVLDNKDADILRNSFLIAYIPFPDICLEFLKKVGNQENVFELMKHINLGLINKEIAEEAVKFDVRCIALFSQDLVDSLSIGEKMTFQDIKNIKLVSEDKSFRNCTFSRLTENERTEIVSYAAVLGTGENLCRVPETSRSERIFLAALRHSGRYLKEVPEKDRTEAMYLTALEHSLYCSGEVLKLFPRRLKTFENCMKAVNMDGLALKYVPKSLKTKEICVYALSSGINDLSNDYDVIRYVPYQDVCLNFLKDNEFIASEIVLHINPGIYDQKFAEQIVKINGLLFNSIPEKWKTEYLARMAINNGCSIFPTGFENSPFVRDLFVTCYPDRIQQIPEQFRTPRLYELAISTIQNIPGLINVPLFRLKMKEEFPSLSDDQILKLYAKGGIEVPEIKLKDGSILNNVSFRFSKKKNKVSIKSRKSVKCDYRISKKKL